MPPGSSRSFCVAGLTRAPLRALGLPQLQPSSDCQGSNSARQGWSHLDES